MFILCARRDTQYLKTHKNIVHNIILSTIINITRKGFIGRVGHHPFRAKQRLIMIVFVSSVIRRTILLCIPSFFLKIDSDRKVF